MRFQPPRCACARVDAVPVLAFASRPRRLRSGPRPSRERRSVNRIAATPQRGRGDFQGNMLSQTHDDDSAAARSETHGTFRCERHGGPGALTITSRTTLTNDHDTTAAVRGDISRWAAHLAGPAPHYFQIVFHSTFTQRVTTSTLTRQSSAMLELTAAAARLKRRANYPTPSPRAETQPP